MRKTISFIQFLTNVLRLNLLIPIRLAKSCLLFLSFTYSICRLRELTTAEIGKLVSVTGVVTRTSEVRPELLQGTFKCLVCGNIIKNVEQQFKYTEVGCLLLLITKYYDLVLLTEHIGRF